MCYMYIHSFHAFSSFLLNFIIFSQSQGFGDDYTAKINKEGQVEAAKLDQCLAQNQGKVVDWLLDLVSDIKPEVRIFLRSGSRERNSFEGILSCALYCALVTLNLSMNSTSYEICLKISQPSLELTLNLFYRYTEITQLQVLPKVLLKSPSPRLTLTYSD